MSEKTAPTPPAEKGGACPAAGSTVPCVTLVKIDSTPCRFVPKGKTQKYEAVGSPSGGTYQWKASGNIAIAGASNNETVLVKGNATSGALNDSKLEVTYTSKFGSAKDTTPITVFEITKIEAKLRSTPCKRDGSKFDTMPATSSTKDSKTFDATTITVVKHCGDLKLVATVKPVGVPITWQVERASDDAPALMGLPTHASDGTDIKRVLKCNATGSFHVMAFVDCNSDGKRGPEEAGIILNVNMVSVEVMPGAENNQVITQTPPTKGFGSTRSNASTLVVDSGTSQGIAPGVNAAYTDAEFVKHPFAVKMTIQLTGGGADQRRGTADIGVGFIQTTSPSDTVTGTYVDGKTLKEVIAQSTATPPTIIAGAPTMLTFPVRDTRGAIDRGIGPYIISSSDAEKSDLPAGGQKRVVRYVDPPAIVLSKSHPVSGSALASISGSNDFEFFLSSFSTHFNENYTVSASGSWSVNYGSYTAAGGWTNVGAAITTGTSMAVHNPQVTGESTNVERCPPNFVDNLRMDAR